MEQEILKDIKGYDGLYKVSNIGNVYSFKFGDKRRLTPRKSGKGGYLSVALYNIGNKFGYKHKQVHRLVAEYFIPNPEFSGRVHHINGNNSDNRVENLCWGKPDINK